MPTARRRPSLPGTSPAWGERSSTTPSGVDRRVELAELDPGVGGGEAPVGRDPGAVPVPLPRRHVALQVGPVPDPLRQVAGERAELDLGHVQPRAVLGGVVDLEPVGQALRPLGREAFVQARRGVGVELVHHQHELLRLGVAPLEQRRDEPRPVAPLAALGDGHVPPARERLEGQEQAGGAVPHVHAVVAFHLPRGRRQRLAALADQLGEGLVQTHDRVFGVVRPAVDLEYILHVVDELRRVFRRDAPHLPQMRLELVFLSVWRTVSCESVSTCSSSTMRSASRRSDQRALPSGGRAQARARRWASCSPSSLRPESRADDLGSSAADSPCSTNRWRARSIVRTLTRTAAAIVSSIHPGPPSASSAWSRTRAWASLRASALPCAIMRSSSPRSSVVSVTRYRFAIAVALPLPHPPAELRYRPVKPSLTEYEWVVWHVVRHSCRL